MIVDDNEMNRMVLQSILCDEYVVVEAENGADKSQAIIGVQMASAYVGTCVMPPLFGMLTKVCGTGLLPLYLCAILILMVWMHESMIKRASAA